MPTLRDRFFTPRVAKAIMSPWRLLAGAAAGLVAALLGASVPAAVVIGVVAYAATVGWTMRGPRSVPIDPFTLSEPWRRYAQGAVSARRRFDGVLAATAAGPIKRRLGDIGKRLDEGVLQCWLIAQRGHELDGAIKRIDVVRVRSRLKSLDPASADDETARLVASLEAQLASADRMKAVSDQTARRLSLMQARLDELVARGTEVGVGAGDGAAIGGELDELVTELEGLRLALEETNRAADPTLPQVTFSESESESDDRDDGGPGPRTSPAS